MRGQVREYREIMQPRQLHPQTIIEGESDLRVFTTEPCQDEAVRGPLRQQRAAIEQYGQRHKEFRSSLVPVEVGGDAPAIVRHMADAATIAAVGPMAAVAGAVAQYVGLQLTEKHKEVIVENGGDLFIQNTVPRQVLIYAGDSPFSNRLALNLKPGKWGVCTSAGTIGHSLSFGRADAVVVVSEDAVLADAVATSLGNRVKDPGDIEPTLQLAGTLPGVTGVLIIIGDKMGAWGSLELGEPREVAGCEGG